MTNNLNLPGDYLAKKTDEFLSAENTLINLALLHFFLKEHSGQLDDDIKNALINKKGDMMLAFSIRSLGASLDMFMTFVLKRPPKAGAVADTIATAVTQQSPASFQTSPSTPPAAPESVFQDYLKARVQELLRGDNTRETLGKIRDLKRAHSRDLSQDLKKALDGKYQEIRDALGLVFGLRQRTGQKVAQATDFTVNPNGVAKDVRKKK